MVKNRMSDVAAMFGKKLNQNFIAVDICGDYRTCMFCEDGFKIKDVDGKYYTDNAWLRELLIGNVYIRYGKENRKQGTLKVMINADRAIKLLDELYKDVMDHDAIQYNYGVGYAIGVIKHLKEEAEQEDKG